MNNMYISDEVISGKPSQLEQYFKEEIANQILKMSGKDFENVINNMRLVADVFELLEDYINEDFIVLKYNPMGAWFVEEDEDEINCYKNNSYYYD